MYGIAGGITGCGFGACLLYVIAFVPGAGFSNGVGVRLNAAPFQLAATLGIAVFLSLAGSVLSIAKTMRISIKDLILGAAEKTGGFAAWKAFSGFVPLCLSFFLPAVIPQNAALIGDTACISAVLLSASLLISYIMEYLRRLLAFLFGFLPGNMPQIALMMLRSNRNVYSGVSMLLIGISSLYMISTLNWSQIRDSEVVFERNLYELTMNVSYADKTTLKLITETDGVNGVLGNYTAGRTKVEGFDEPIWHIQGINPSCFSCFQKLKTDGDENELLASLDKGRNILLSNMLRLPLQGR